MNINDKDKTAYKTIGEVAKEVGLINNKTGHLQTHTIRFWETQFKKIKPTIRAGNRRYYSNENIKYIKYIKYLLKEKGLTISGAKKIMDAKDSTSIDDGVSLGVYNSSLKTNKVIKEKLKNIEKIIKELKRFK